MVGAIGIAVQLITLAILKTILHMPYLIATALAVEAAVIHNFLWHERFTWADRASRGSVARFLKFNLTTGMFSIAGNVLLMKWFVGYLGFPYLTANGAAIALCSVANFTVSDRAVFKASRLSGEREVL
jgi:putative flippase GtrA